MAVDPGAADKDAGGGHARRRPDEFADTGRTRAENSRTLRTGMDANWQALRFSNRSRAQFYAADLSGIFGCRSSPFQCPRACPEKVGRGSI